MAELVLTRHASCTLGRLSTVLQKTLGIQVNWASATQSHGPETSSLPQGIVPVLVQPQSTPSNPVRPPPPSGLDPTCRKWYSPIAGIFGHVYFPFYISERGVPGGRSPPRKKMEVPGGFGLPEIFLILRIRDKRFFF